MKAVLVVMAASIVVGACGEPSATDSDEGAGRDRQTVDLDFTEDELRRILTLSPLPRPTDPTNRYFEDHRAARFGRYLFFDQNLSRDGDISCATCHDSEKGWSDGKTLSEGKETLTRHSMTLWNVAYNRWFFWDGRADSLWAQAVGPLEAPKEHAGSRLQYLHYVAGDARLKRAYEAIFGALPVDRKLSRLPPAGRPLLVAERELRERQAAIGPEHAHTTTDPENQRIPPRGALATDHPLAAAWSKLSPADEVMVNRFYSNVGKAIAAYVGRIVSRRSPFDVFVEGIIDGDAAKISELSTAARRGLRFFIGRGNCTACHGGPTFSDLEFHDNLVPPLHAALPADEGRRRGLHLVRQDPFRGTEAYSDATDGEASLKLDYLPSHGHSGRELKTPHAAQRGGDCALHAPGTVAGSGGGPAVFIRRWRVPSGMGRARSAF